MSLRGIVQYKSIILVGGSAFGSSTVATKITLCSAATGLCDDN